MSKEWASSPNPGLSTSWQPAVLAAARPCVRVTSRSYLTAASGPDDAAPRSLLVQVFRRSEVFTRVGRFHDLSSSTYTSRMPITTTPSPANAEGRGIEEIRHDGKVLAIILRASFSEQGVSFITPDEYSQQVGYMRHPQGKVIEPHVHNEVTRTITLTQEVLLIRRGRVRVDIYNDQQTYLESRILEQGDLILLSQGGHGFEALEELEMIEVKQGPYVGGRDKIRFSVPKQGITSTHESQPGAEE